MSPSDAGVLPSAPDAVAECDACAPRPNEVADEDAGALPSAPDECEDPSLRVTISTLLGEMVDLMHLTRLPVPAYSSHLSSSHNPRSDTAQPGDGDWFADQDFVRLNLDQSVTLLDVEGPGAITRIWSASPSGRLRVYIDGALEPAIDASLAALLRGDEGPFAAPFAFVAAFGHNLYFPIPFSTGCRVTLTGTEEDEIVTYYHVTYRQYAADTDVESFGSEALDRATCMRDRAALALSALSPGTDATAEGDTSMHALSSADGPEAAAVLAAPSGGGVLRQLRVWPADASIDALRGTLLAVEMDGELTVRVPLSEFFALGLGAQEVNSLPVSRDAEGTLTSRWPMPFEQEARIWLESTGAGELDVALEAVVAAEPWTARSLYFYATWAAPETFPSKPPFDYAFAEMEGEGFYVGNTLNVVNRNAAWWGEGDERIYVDDEAFPSHFGTGTEDYFGYAWCSNAMFSTPYIGQTVTTTHQSFGYSSLYRFLILDPIPFSRSLRFDLEVRHWGGPVDVTYDGMSVWYARPGAVASGLDAATDAFRVPALGVDPPEGIGAGPYRCGG